MPSVLPARLREPVLRGWVEWGSLGDGGYPAATTPPGCLGTERTCARVVLSPGLVWGTLSNDAGRAAAEAGVLARDGVGRVSPAEGFVSQSERLSQA